MNDSAVDAKETKTAMLGLFVEILERDASIRFTVTGRSMAPFMRGGEVVTIKKVSCSELRIGDLIFFESPIGSPVLHRLVRRRIGTGGYLTFQTKGDALIAFDEEITESRVLGKVLQIERPAQSDRTTRIDMNSLFYRCMNYSIAVAGFFKTQTYFFLSAALAKIT